MRIFGASFLSGAATCNMYIYIYIYIYVYVCISICVCICICIGRGIGIGICVYIYIYVYVYGFHGTVSDSNLFTWVATCSQATFPRSLTHGHLWARTLNP